MRSFTSEVDRYWVCALCSARTLPVSRSTTAKLTEVPESGSRSDFGAVAAGVAKTAIAVAGARGTIVDNRNDLHMSTSSADSRTHSDTEKTQSVFPWMAGRCMGSGPPYPGGGT